MTTTDWVASPQRSLGKDRQSAPTFPRNSQTGYIRLFEASRKSAKIFTMKVTLPLKEMTVSEKIGIMEEIWSDLSSAKEGYSPPDWHDDSLALYAGIHRKKSKD